MDKKRLLLGFAILFLLAGALLVCLAPGGLLHKTSASQGNIMGFEILGEPAVHLGMPGPIAGFVLLGIGAVGLVFRFALK
jgi:hypothetical protein